VTAYRVEPLRPDTFEAFARLVEKHNGVWGGCWCLSFHPKNPERGQSQAGNRALKLRLVREDQAHAALVFDGDQAVGWCQFGSPEELPNITHRKEVEDRQVPPPDYRITCFFVDRDHRRDGIAAVALKGALELISKQGGGVVEAYPYDIGDKKVSSSFLYNGTRALFDQAGFEYLGPKGKNHCIMRTSIEPS
jgi:ribosomal protein S18 acetylase RimI-like enzyme